MDAARARHRRWRSPLPCAPRAGRGRGRGAQRPPPRAGRSSRARPRDGASRFPRPRRAGAAAVARAGASRCSSGRSRAPIPTTTPTTTWCGAGELLDGLAPTFRPTPRRPSTRSTSRSARVLGLVFGESADRALVLVCLLSHAALVLGTYRLGAAVFGRWSGALARAVRRRERVVPALRRARVRGRAVPRARRLGGRARGRGDGPLAAVRAARRSPGLLRPEAWVLDGALRWLWTLRPRRPRRSAPLARRRRLLSRPSSGRSPT